MIRDYRSRDEWMLHEERLVADALSEAVALLESVADGDARLTLLARHIDAERRARGVLWNRATTDADISAWAIACDANMRDYDEAADALHGKEAA